MMMRRSMFYDDGIVMRMMVRMCDDSYDDDDKDV